MDNLESIYSHDDLKSEAISVSINSYENKKEIGLHCGGENKT